MDTDTQDRIFDRKRLNRREFLGRVGWGTAGVAALVAGGGRSHASAAPVPYPDWIPASDKPPRRGGTLTRASSWDPPVIDPRLTQSVGLFQFAGLVCNRPPGVRIETEYLVGLHRHEP